MRRGMVMLVTALSSLGLFSPAEAAEPTAEELVAFLYQGWEDGAEVNRYRATRESASPAIFRLRPVADAARQDEILTVERKSDCEYVFSHGSADRPFRVTLDFSVLEGIAIQGNAPGALKRIWTVAGKPKATSHRAGEGFCSDEAMPNQCFAYTRPSLAFPVAVTRERIEAALADFKTRFCKGAVQPAAAPVALAHPADPSIEEVVGFLATSYADGLEIDGLKATRVDESPAVLELAPAAGGPAAARISVEKLSGCRYRITREDLAGGSSSYAYLLNLGTTFGYNYDIAPEGGARRAPLTDDPAFCIAESGDNPCRAVLQNGPQLPKAVTYDYLSAIYDDFGSRLCAPGLSNPPPPQAGVTPEETAALLWLALEDGATLGPETIRQESESPAVFVSRMTESGADAARISVTRQGESCRFAYRIDYVQEVFDAFGEPLKEVAFEIDFSKATGIMRFSNESNDFQFRADEEMCTPVAPTTDCYQGRLSNSPLLPLNADRGEEALMVMIYNYCKSG